MSMFSKVENIANAKKWCLSLVLTFLLGSQEIVYAQCINSSATTPVTVLDETGSIPGSKTLSNGVGTLVDTTNPGTIAIDAAGPIPFTISSYSAGSAYTPAANTFTIVSAASQINLPASSSIPAGSQIALTIGGSQGATIINTASGAGDHIIFNGSSSNSSITINNSDEIVLLNQGSNLWQVLQFLPNGGTGSPAGSTWSVSVGGTGQATLSQFSTLVGNGASPIAAVAPSSTSGLPFISNGVASNPGFGTAVVAGGGTGQSTLTSHGVLLGQATSSVTAVAPAASGNLLIAQGTGSDPQMKAMSGDATISGTGAISVTKTGGIPFATSATTDATNASNISSGILAIAHGGTGVSSLVNPVVENVRMYLSAGSPTSDVSNDTSNFYVGPYGGNTVALPDSSGGNFSLLNLSEITTALPAQTFRLMDVFLYNNAGSVALTTTYWDSSGQATGSITSVTAANGCTVSATNSLTAGQYVGITGLSGSMGTYLNNKVYKVSSASGSQFVLETGVNTTSLTPVANTGTFYVIPTARTTGLSFQNGCYLQTGSLNHLYIGTIIVGTEGTSARADDSTATRGVWNYFNRLPRHLNCVDTAASWSYNGTAYRPRDNNSVAGVGRMEYVVGIAEEPVTGACSMVSANSLTSANFNAISLNTLLGTSTALLGPLRGSELVAGDNFASASATTSILPSIGYSFAQAVEKVSAGSATWTGNGLDPMAASSWMNGRW